MGILKKILALLRPAVFVFAFALFPFNGLAATPEELRSEIQQKQNEIQKLEQQIAAFKNEIKNKQSQEKTLASQINYMESQIRRLLSEIRLTETKISAASLMIEELKNDILARSAEIEKQRNNLGAVIRQINEYDQENQLSLILKNDNFSDFLNQVQFADNLQGDVKDKLVKIKNLKKELEGQKMEMESRKESLEELKTDLSGKNMVLNGQVDEKETLLTQTKNQEKKYQQMLSDLQKKRQEIEKEIYLLEDKLRLLIDPNSIPGSRQGLFAWPLKSYVTQKYGPTSQTGFVNSVYNFHNGIDIEADIGDPVRAPLEGVVKARGDNGKYAYGKWIAIDHENGLITLYGHFSSYAVSVGQQVKTGQVIGYAGNTGFSTGPHLHFTVYSTNTFSVEEKWYGLLPLGGSINPMNYL
jgi:murein DD-endopeptidase MepM/ murein hydrolase activator NlpD